MIGTNYKLKLLQVIGNSFKKIPIEGVKGKVLSRQAINNVIINEQGCFLRILATDKPNASELRDIIDSNRQDLRVDQVHVAGEAIDYRAILPNRKPFYYYSVVSKIKAKYLFQDIIATIDSNFKTLHQYVLDDEKKNQNIVIDFSSPNIAKPFHYGHLKSTILGNYLANLNQFMGHNVTKLNFIGDWGTQYGLLSLGLDNEGESDYSPHSADSKSQNNKSFLRHLLDVYVKANERGRNDDTFFQQAKKKFSEMSENQDSVQYKRWKRIRDISLEELKVSYERIGIEFDQYDYESNYAKKSIEIVKELQQKGLIFLQDDGVLYAKVPKKDKIHDVNLLKSDGSSLYLSRDVAAALDRMQRFKFDKMLYVVGADQERHFHSLKEIIRQINCDWADKLIHVKMGKVLGLSSRLGNTVLLSDIIDEATSQFYQITQSVPTSKISKSDDEKLREVAKHLTISSLFVFDMRQPRTSNYELNWLGVMLPEHKSGINLQTTYARLSSLMRKSQDLGYKPFTNEEVQTCEVLVMESIACEEALNLLSVLHALDNALHVSYWNLDPSMLVNYTIRLCKAINRARLAKHLSVTQEADEMAARTRLTLFSAAHKQLDMLIRLIGLKPLSKV